MPQYKPSPNQAKKLITKKEDLTSHFDKRCFWIRNLVRTIKTKTNNGVIMGVLSRMDETGKLWQDQVRHSVVKNMADKTAYTSPTWKQCLKGDLNCSNGTEGFLMHVV